MIFRLRPAESHLVMTSARRNTYSSARLLQTSTTPYTFPAPTYTLLTKLFSPPPALTIPSASI
jgi:hypothetical protein